MSHLRISPRSWVTAALGVLLAAGLGLSRAWVGDDGFINLRVARNLLAGHGPVFNVGERVEAITSPLWLYLIAAFGSTGLRLEYVAAYGGILLSSVSFGVAFLAARELWLSEFESGAEPFFLPLGLLVFLAVPVGWDYFSSGLENGLSYLWLSLVFGLCVRVSRWRLEMPRRSLILAGTLFGLGPLVRPELGLFAVFWLGLLAFQMRVRTLWLALGAALVAGGYQIFRMGYYGVLLPHPALAKMAAVSRWEQGFHFAENFFGLYWLLLPLALVVGSLVILTRRESKPRLLVWATVLAGTLYALYIIRVGGGFMHGRLFLPALFGFLLPAMAVPLPAPKAARVSIQAAFGATLVWALVCGFTIRVARANQWGIGDERGWYSRQAGVKHPVRIEDYYRFSWHAMGRSRQQTSENLCPRGRERCERVFLKEWGGRFPLRSDLRPSIKTVNDAYAIGIIGYLLDEHVHLVDRGGLADPVAARLRVEQRGRVGHERELSEAWLRARFGPAHDQRPDVAAARQAMSCGVLSELADATTAPLSLGRFIRNIRAAWYLTFTDVPAQPVEAARLLCSW